MLDSEKLHNAISGLAAEDKFSGCVQIADREKVIFSKAYGYASRSYLAENRIDTKFNMASLGKMFTGVAILQLVEKGVLSLEAPITGYCQGLISEKYLKKQPCNIF